MPLPLLTGHQWLMLKVTCHEIHASLRRYRTVNPEHHQFIVESLKLAADVTHRYELFGTIQFKLITESITLLFIEGDSDPSKHHVYIYPTPDKPPRTTRGAEIGQ